MGDSSPLGRSSILFGIHSQSKAQRELQRIRRLNKRFTLIAAAAIFILVLAMICLVVLDLYTSASIIKRQNKTQSLTEQRIEHLGDLIRTQQWKLVKDVDLEPEESEGAEERWDTVSEAANFLQRNKYDENSKMQKSRSNTTVEYSNHRYSDDPDFGKPEQRIGWKPRPFSLKMDQVETERPVNSIQDILGHASEPEDKIVLPPAGFSKPMRFRGVFLHPPSETLPLQSNQHTQDRRGEYHKKINDYFTGHKQINLGQRGSTELMEGNSNIHETFAKPEHYTKAIYHPYNKEEPQIELRKQWTRGSKNPKPKRKPFTVMLDIYPMDKTEDIGMVVPMVSSPKKPKSTIFVPIRPGEKFYEPKPTPTRYLSQIVVPPKQRKGERMLMKLNLYPKNAQRRTWSWFNKGSSESSTEACMPKGMNLMGHNPFGKPITAKWKDNKGQIMHANFVTLNKWEERSDDMLDPR